MKRDLMPDIETGVGFMMVFIVFFVLWFLEKRWRTEDDRTMFKNIHEQLENKFAPKEDVNALKNLMSEIHKGFAKFKEALPKRNVEMTEEEYEQWQKIKTTHG